ncbi:carbohydrate ABC transporter ATP-binding protein, CUT1 family [Sphaerochaeta associata]|jgi:multiple sugar transport system ATP-binding protein|uniref:ABC transporter ATP-binding protein n=1 Tax=Sphaerochaeta associata TaxID=1129264 RepID=A0ABY4D885_9SPIR|nr:ABC transporter ATP-binding protein [Sphaerochaeta associata]UOM50494.1 ABC transporter ATP-binding protein [Sphaerochaeta associata]SMP40870.1 carbohydrate ABC transporter ATP-binding protein, CUT1 family [Sphaerochaeta associata]
MSTIQLLNIDKYYGENHVLKNLNLTINDGEFMTLLGPSGCGKTTTLRIIAGLEKPQGGLMSIGDREIINANERFYEEPGKRNLNLVFQSYALWPHMTVFENVAFGLDVAKETKDNIKKRVTKVLKQMRIDEFAERYPSELSGGQQQRVAIARAIVTEPQVLLLDEPLSNLDAKLRVEMRSELKRLHHEMGTTIVYVTHDQTEALTMSSRIAVFFNGILDQVDTPMEIYQNPSSLRVADFIGNPKINFVDATAVHANNSFSVQSELGTLICSLDQLVADAPKGEFKAVLGIRPEIVSIKKKKADGLISAKIVSVMPAGSETLIYVTVGSQTLLVKQNGLRHYDVDQDVYLTLDPAKINVFDSTSKLLVKRAVVDAE